MLDANKHSPAGTYDPSTHRMLNFHDAAAKFRDGADTPRAYLERCIERIEALDQAVMAFAYLNLEQARHAADESSARYETGKPLSAVDGMPVGIKDLIETYDMPTEFGSELFRGHQPMTDAACVAALRKGGAVLVGKTVTVCFGGGDPARTRNPFDTRRTPGGSSSGTAVAVASRMLPVALGTHARGSTIRRRASAARTRSSPRSVRSIVRAHSRWLTAWITSVCSQARCPTSGRRLASSRTKPAAIRRTRASLVRLRRLFPASPRDLPASTPRDSRPRNQPRRNNSNPMSDDWLGPAWKSSRAAMIP
jgi:hypothetical protein